MKKITMTEEQKKTATRAVNLISIAGGSYILFKRFLHSETAEKIEEKIIRKMLSYHIDMHELSFYAVYGSFKDIVPVGAHAQINSAVEAVINPYLSSVT